jgi:hypothetical protein
MENTIHKALAWCQTQFYTKRWMTDSKITASV